MMNEVRIVRLNLIYLLYIIVVKNTVIIKIWMWNTSNHISNNEFFSITLYWDYIFNCRSWEDKS